MLIIQHCLQTFDIHGLEQLKSILFSSNQTEITRSIILLNITHAEVFSLNYTEA